MQIVPNKTKQNNNIKKLIREDSQKLIVAKILLNTVKRFASVMPVVID